MTVDGWYALPFSNSVTVGNMLTLTYTVMFDDANFADFSFDPTLKIQPRSAENPPHRQSAGA